MREQLQKVFRSFLVVLILANVVAIIAESHDGLRDIYKNYFWGFEIFSVIIFSLEYAGRLFFAIYHTPKRRFHATVSFVFSPMAIIDLLAVVPFYLPSLIGLDLRFIRILRIFRLLRVFKLGRYAESMNLIFQAISRKKEELFVSVGITFILMIIASALMYEIEHEVQPKAFPYILEAMWWAVATLTTVGYGDVYPITGMGRILAGFIAVLGVGLVALPAGLLPASFLDLLQKKQKSETTDHPNYCPHCGKSLKN